MSNIEQVKAKIRNIAKSKNLNAQEVLQIYMFERFIDRLSISKYKNNFILKGGLLVASMIGISERTTMDMDATIIGAAVSEDYIVNLVKTIIEIDANDGVRFDYQGISKIRLNDNYSGFCVVIIASIDKTRAPLKIDITTGDVITPHHIDYSYLLMFENRSVSVQAYPLETILAEKIETILSRNITTTRARDFYDIYILYKLYNENIKWDILSTALKNTALKRNSIDELNDANEIINELREYSYTASIWKRYQNENKYTKEVRLNDCLDTLSTIIDSLNLPLNKSIKKSFYEPKQ